MQTCDHIRSINYASAVSRRERARQQAARSAMLEQRSASRG